MTTYVCPICGSSDIVHEAYCTKGVNDETSEWEFLETALTYCLDCNYEVDEWPELPTYEEFFGCSEDNETNEDEYEIEE